MSEIKTIAWENGCVVMIDQRKLPQREVYTAFRDYRAVIRAIKTMVIRGAPAIGIAAAMGLALGAGGMRKGSRQKFNEKWSAMCREMASARPTAVNLFWAIERMRKLADGYPNAKPNELADRLLGEAETILAEDIAANRRMGAWGQTLFSDGCTVLTHCNAGALATGGYGTALGVIRAAHETGKRISVFADETRPFLQGARLTSWELKKCGIPVTLISDNAAGSLMRMGRINAVIVGADRIARNGDIANKIGTYSVAVLAKENGIPFYVAAPESTIDRNLAGGGQIPIEERSPEEITHYSGRRIAPEGVPALNMAFDVTPNAYVTAIITEDGIIRAPYNFRQAPGY
ncbi:MAG: S-methyl-5-thioribose-1-phosphate isomerase [Pseudomonadota bacterium]